MLGFLFDFEVIQDGSMRCDVNVSVRPNGDPQFGQRVEIKNMNSFSAMQRAIEFEIERQVWLAIGSLPTLSASECWRRCTSPFFGIKYRESYQLCVIWGFRVCLDLWKDLFSKCVWLESSLILICAAHTLSLSEPAVSLIASLCQHYAASYHQ